MLEFVMLEMYLRFAPIATPILIFVVGFLVFTIIHHKKEYEKDLERQREHARNRHNHKERVRSRRGHNKHTEETVCEEEGMTITTRTTYTGNMTPEVRKAFDEVQQEMRNTHREMFKGVGKIFDALDQVGKGK